MGDTKSTLTWILKDEVSRGAQNMKGNLDDAGAAATRNKGAFGGLGGAITGLINPMTLAVGGAAALGAGLVAAVGAAAEEEKNIARMGAALEASIPGWDGNTDAIEAAISARENLAFSDDELRSSFATLVTATGDVDAALELQNTAMDLARLKGIDLETASAALAKANQGSTRELKALGLEIDDNATSTQILAQIQQAATGQAAAYADTSAAKWETLQNKFGDVVEEVGSALLPILETLLDFAINDLIPAIEEFARVVGPVLKAAFKIVGDFITWWMKNVVQPAIDLILGLIGFVQSAIKFLQDLGVIARSVPGQPSGGARSSPIPKASGGPVRPGGTYLVGEQGPEILVMGRQAGNIIPSGGGGVPVQIPILLDGREIARVVDEQLYYGIRRASPQTGRA